jgi:hypothetical protein
VALGGQRWTLVFAAVVAASVARMIALTGTITLPFLAPIDDISCITIVVLSSMGKPVLPFLLLQMN